LSVWTAEDIGKCAASESAKEGEECEPQALTLSRSVSWSRKRITKVEGEAIAERSRRKSVLRLVLAMKYLAAGQALRHANTLIRLVAILVTK